MTRAARTLLGPAWSWLLEEWEPWLKWKILDVSNAATSRSSFLLQKLTWLALRVVFQILYSLVIVIALRRFKKSSVLHWLKDA